MQKGRYKERDGEGKQRMKRKPKRHDGHVGESGQMRVKHTVLYLNENIELA